MNSKAVKALRKKFIFIAMLSIGGVMFCFVIIFNLSTSFSIRREIGLELDGLYNYFASEITGKEINGTLQTLQTDDEGSGKAAQVTADELAGYLKAVRNQNSKEDGRWMSGNIYDFAALLDTQGKAVTVLPEEMDEQAVEAVSSVSEKLFAQKSDFGHFGNYYYMLRSLDERSLLVFDDCSVQIGNMRRNMYTSLVLWLGVLIIVFWPVYFLSDQMIQPELKNIERQKQFITNASHELKTPLAVIRANTELIELMNGESEWTSSTLRQVDRMNGLIKNLVMIARAEEKADKSAMAEIDVSAAVRDTAETFAPVATQDGKELVQEIEENVRMVAEEATVRQLASLLLDNAIKYCDDGGKIVCQLAKRGKGKGIRLAVSNSYAAGESIDYSRFFERFYREDSSHNTEKGGYGIGLSIAESIVTSYNGSISASWKNGMISFVCVLV